MKNQHSIQNPMSVNIDSQKGLTLVEILITVLILAVGSLGIAAMQIAGLNYSSGAYARTQATHFAEDMASRLKSNREEALEDNPAYEIDNFTNTFATNDNCITDTCNPIELANFDKNTWLLGIARALPSGRGQVTFNDTINADGATERIYSIAIQWRQIAVSTEAQVDTDPDDDLKDITFRVAI